MDAVIPAMLYFHRHQQSAGVTQLVECLLPKQVAVGSSPITRSDSLVSRMETGVFVPLPDSHVVHDNLIFAPPAEARPPMGPCLCQRTHDDQGFRGSEWSTYPTTLPAHLLAARRQTVGT
jgi:hypothetical protein